MWRWNKCSTRSYEGSIIIYDFVIRRVVWSTDIGSWDVALKVIIVNPNLELAEVDPIEVVCQIDYFTNNAGGWFSYPAILLSICI